MLISNSFALRELSPQHGEPPILDGKTNSYDDEWINATKISLNLYTDMNATSSDKGLPVKVWVMLNDTSVFISVQFELETHKPDEFIGILISEDVEDGGNYIDARFGQFTKLGQENTSFEFKDFFISNNKFIKDNQSNGMANASLEGKKVTYEFCIPLDNDISENDVLMEYGHFHNFKIVYGENSNYNSSIKKENAVEVKINFPPEPKPVDPFQDYINIVFAVIFISIAALLGFYSFKIIQLKKKLERKRGG